MNEAIHETGDKFQKRPLNFTSKAAILASLNHSLENSIGETIYIDATYDESDVTKYKTKYIDRIATLQETSNILINANVGTPDDHHRYDVVVLDTDRDCITATMRGERKFFPEETVHGVLEAKYQKGMNTPESILENSDVDQWGDYSREIDKLSTIDLPEKHLAIFNTRNIFQQEHTDEYSTELARKRYENLANRCEQDEIIVHEFHPAPI